MLAQGTAPGRARAAYFVERFEEMGDIRLGEAGEENFARLGNPGIEASQQAQALWLDVAEHLSAIGLRPLPTNECRGFEPVDHARDSRRLFDHSCADFKSGQSCLPCAAEDPQDVVLGQCHAFRFENFSQTPPEDISGSQDRDHGFILRGRKWFGLAQVSQQRALWHVSNHTNQ